MRRWFLLLDCAQIDDQNGALTMLDRLRRFLLGVAIDALVGRFKLFLLTARTLFSRATICKVLS